MPKGTLSDGQGVYCGLSPASEVFLILLPNYMYIHVYEIIIQKFCDRNTPNLNTTYSPLLTSGG